MTPVSQFFQGYAYHPEYGYGKISHKEKFLYEGKLQNFWKIEFDNLNPDKYYFHEDMFRVVSETEYFANQIIND